MGISIDVQGFLERSLSLNGALWFLGISGFALGAVSLYWRRLRRPAPPAKWILAFVGGAVFSAVVLAALFLQTVAVATGPSSLEWILVAFTFFVAGCVGCAAVLWLITRTLRRESPQVPTRPPWVLGVVGFWAGALLGHFLSTGLVLIVMVSATA